MTVGVLKVDKNKHRLSLGPGYHPTTVWSVGDHDQAKSRKQLAEDALRGYHNGPDAPIAATADAALAAETASALILVEGISDRIAVEALAERSGRHLAADGVVVFPIGGAQAIGRYLPQLVSARPDRLVVGLCDVGEEVFFRNAVAIAGLGSPTDRPALESAGFFVCIDDLEDELIRACGQEMIEAMLESQGDLRSFRTMQKQPVWRDRGFQAQMRRFLGAGAGRKLRYARLLTKAVETDRIPPPLTKVLDRV